MSENQLAPMMAAAALSLQYCADVMNFGDFTRWCQSKGAVIPEEEPFREFLTDSAMAFSVIGKTQLIEDWKEGMAEKLDEIFSAEDLCFYSCGGTWRSAREWTRIFSTPRKIQGDQGKEGESPERKKE